MPTVNYNRTFTSALIVLEPSMRDSAPELASEWLSVLTTYLLILSYICIFILGLVGNVLVIVTLTRNKRFKVRVQKPKLRYHSLRLRRAGRDFWETAVHVVDGYLHRTKVDLSRATCPLADRGSRSWLV